MARLREHSLPIGSALGMLNCENPFLLGTMMKRPFGMAAQRRHVKIVVFISLLMLVDGRGKGLGPAMLYAEPQELIEPAPAPLSATPEVDLHVKLAAALYKVGNYLEAASELNVAYELQPQPVYLFNIAQAYRRALRARAAQVMYKRFLEMAPAHPLAPEARGYMLDMEALGRAEDAKALVQLQLLRERQRNQPFYKQGWFYGTVAAVLGASAIAVGLGVGLARREPATTGGFVDLSLGRAF